MLNIIAPKKSQIGGTDQGRDWSGVWLVLFFLIFIVGGLTLGELERVEREKTQKCEGK